MKNEQTITAKQAREAARLSTQDAAQRAQVSVGYLRRCERQGTPYLLARRLAALYHCSLDVFLTHRKEGNKRTK